MGILTQSDPWKREFTEVWRQERWFLRRYERPKENDLLQKAERIVPDRLLETLNQAFLKAFQMIFQRGDGLIRRLEGQERRREIYARNAAADQADRESLRAFSRAAKRAGRGGVLFSAAAGTGMGVLGIALPDVALLTGMLLKSLYETAESFGFPCEGEAERIYALRLLETALSQGEALHSGNRDLDRYAQEGSFQEERSLEEQIRRTANQLSQAILMEKAVQNIPVLGAVGGVCDLLCLRRVRSYAQIKYHKRFLLARRLGEQ